MDVLVHENSVLLEQIYWTAKIYQYECFHDARMIIFHMNYMSKRFILVYSGDILDGNYILCVGYMTTVGVLPVRWLHDHCWWPSCGYVFFGDNIPVIKVRQNQPC